MSRTAQRVHLDLEIGEHAVDYSHMAEKEKLSELQLRLKQLLNQVDQISKEQAYQRVRAVCRYSFFTKELCYGKLCVNGTVLCDNCLIKRMHSDCARKKPYVTPTFQGHFCSTEKFDF